MNYPNYPPSRQPGTNYGLVPLSAPIVRALIPVQAPRASLKAVAIIQEGYLLTLVRLRPFKAFRGRVARSQVPGQPQPASHNPFILVMRGKAGSVSIARLLACFDANGAAGKCQWTRDLHLILNHTWLPRVSSQALPFKFKARYIICMPHAMANAISYHLTIPRRLHPYATQLATHNPQYHTTPRILLLILHIKRTNDDSEACNNLHLIIFSSSSPPQCLCISDSSRSRP